MSIFNTTDNKMPSENDFSKIINDKDNQIEQLTKKLQSTENKIQNIEQQLDDERISGMRVLAARLAHDLKNPLSTIKNVIELLESKQHMKIEDKIIKYRTLNRAYERMSHQVNDVLAFAEMRELALKNCVLTDLVHLSMVDVDLPSEIKMNIDKNPVVLQCDQSQNNFIIFKFIS